MWLLGRMCVCFCFGGLRKEMRPEKAENGWVMSIDNSCCNISAIIRRQWQTNKHPVVLKLLCSTKVIDARPCLFSLMPQWKLRLICNTQDSVTFWIVLHLLRLDRYYLNFVMFLFIIIHVKGVSWIISITIIIHSPSGFFQGNAIKLVLLPFDA